MIEKELPVELVNLTEANKRFYDDMHRFICVAAGRRSRKDLIATRKMLTDPGRGALVLPGQMYIFLAPTRPQAKAIFWERLLRDTKLFRESVSHSELKIKLLNDSVLWVTGLDRPERVEGITEPPIKGVQITEISDVKQGAWQSNIRPTLSDNAGFAFIVGVPEGKDHFHDLCLHASGGSLPKPRAGKGAYAENGEWSYHSWFSADVLPEKEISQAKIDLDEITFKREYEASFEGMAGLAYYAFSNSNIRDDFDYEKGMQIDIGMDFNVDPMCAVEGHIVNNKYYQHGETVLRNSNTIEMCQAIVNKYRLEKNRDGKYPVTVYPDATGAARHSGAPITDLETIKKFGFRVRAARSNPLQRDRLNAVNSAMKPMEGEERYFVHPRCVNTIADFARVERDESGNIVKDMEAEGKPYVHITDALGYILFNGIIYKQNRWNR
jgi:hypothetical protein